MKYLTVLTAMVLVLFGAGSPAAADDPWERIPCFSGAIERIDVTNGDYLTLTGYLDCGVPENNPGPLWGYAVFLAGMPYGTLNDTDLQPYSYGNRTAFSNRMQVETLPEALGICVVTDYDVRIACVKVEWKTTTPPIMMVGPMPVDDELATRPLQRRSDGSPNPVCGHC